MSVLKRFISGLSKVSAYALLTLLTLNPLTTYADDTDIFLGNVSIDTGLGQATQPNILFMLDTSGSMGSDINGQNPRFTGEPSRLQVLQDVFGALVDSAQNVNIGIGRFRPDRGGTISYPIADLNADSGLVEQQLSADDIGRPRIPQPVSLLGRTLNGSDDAIQSVPDNRVIIDGTNIILASGVQSSSVGGNISVTAPSDGFEELAWPFNLSGDADRGTANIAIPIAELPRFVCTRFNRRGRCRRGFFERSEERLGFFRFTGVNIPQGSSITSATIQFRAAQDDNSPVDFQVSIEDIDSSGTLLDGFGGMTLFSGTNNQRPYTDVTFPRGPTRNWRPPQFRRDNTYTTNNLNDLVQHVVNRPGWRAGNAMAFKFAPRFRPSEGRRVVRQTSNVRLNVEYSNTASTLVDNTVGLRFPGLNIPQGARIDSARLVVNANANNSSNMNLRIAAEATDNSQPFTTSSNITARARTAATTTWQQSAAVPWVAGTDYRSDELTGLVQEVVNRGGWCGGNALSLILSGEGLRPIVTVEGSVAQSARLEVTYTPEFAGADTGCNLNQQSYQVLGDEDDADQNVSTGSVVVNDLNLRTGSHYVGLRFDNVDLPRNAEVTSASIELIANGTSQANVRVRGEDSDTSAIYTTARSSISGRNMTSAVVDWVFTPASLGAKVRSPDLRTVVQEIVDRGGWQSGNAMSMILEPQAGAVPAAGHESSAFDAARLYIDYKVNLAEETAGSGRSGITVRQRLKQIVNSYPASGGTPATASLLEALFYYRGDDVEFGRRRIDQLTLNNVPGFAPLAANARLSMPATYSPLDAPISRPANCPGADSSSEACILENIPSQPKYVSPVLNSCQTNYVVLLSDGEPNRLYPRTDRERFSVPFDDRGLVSNAVNFTGTCSGDFECSQAIAEYMKTQDIRDDVTGVQNITVHTVGFGIDSAYLEGIADAGGGDYFTASSPDELVNAFQQILADAVNSPQTFTAPGVAVSAFNRLQTSDSVYFSLFLPTIQRRWDGNLKRYRFDGENIVDVNSNIAIDNGVYVSGAQSFWSQQPDGNQVAAGGAGEVLVRNGHAARTFYTYFDTGSPRNVALTQSGRYALTENNDALRSSGLWGFGQTDAGRRQLINWVRGQDISDRDGDGDTSDTRFSFGDPLHSRPVTVTYDGGANLQDESDDNVKILVSTNAGVVHMLDAATGREEWAFMPGEALGAQRTLFNDPQGAHVYTVDGPVNVFFDDANNDGIISAADGDRVYAFVTFRRGGRSMYMLDITDFRNPVIRWRIDPSTAGYSEIGQSWSEPSVVRMNIGGSAREVVVFGGGYDTQYDDPQNNQASTSGTGVYIADLNTGERILWMSASVNADLRVPGMDAAVPGNVSVQDLNGADGLVDRLYFGDLRGQMWRVDLANIDVGNAGDSIADRLAVLAGTRPEDRRRFHYEPLVVPFEEETGQFFYILFTSGDRENPLDQTVRNRFYAIKDRLTALVDNNSDNLADIGRDFDESDLFDSTSNILQDGTEAERTAARQELLNADGWYIVMQEDDNSFIGEKGLSSGVAQRGIWTLTTYVPVVANSSGVNVCSTSVIGATRLFTLSLLGGTAVTSNNDGNDADLDRDDRFDRNPGGLVSGLHDTVTELSAQTTSPDGTVGTSCRLERGGGNLAVTLCQNRIYSSGYRWEQ